MFTVVLDTCAIWGSFDRDLLLSLAVEGLYRPLISDVSIRELELCEIEKLSRHHDVTYAQQRAARLIGELRTHFSDAIVATDQAGVTARGLPDPDDEHVLAAAIIGGASAIVTENIRDFPSDVLPETIELLRPMDFAALTVSLDPDRALAAFEAMSLRSGGKGPRQTTAELIDRFGLRPSAASAARLMHSNLNDTRQAPRATERES